MQDAATQRNLHSLCSLSHRERYKIAGHLGRYGMKRSETLRYGINWLEVRKLNILPHRRGETRQHDDESRRSEMSFVELGNGQLAWTIFEKTE